MKIIILVISLLLVGINPQSERLQPQDAERTKELARAVELSAQVVKLYNDRRYKEALPLAQQVVEIRQQFLSPNDGLLGAALSNLGFLYVATKKDDEADKAFQRTLSVYESRSEKNDLVLSSILSALAYVRVRKHDYERAEPLLLRSLEIQEKQLGPTNPRTVEAMKDYACLSLTMSNQGVFDRSEPDALRRRAGCWLFEFEKNCTEDDTLKSEGIINGKAVRLTAPRYPPAARQKRLSGRVFTAILIDEAGNVINARPVCGNQMAVEAALLSKFSPTLVNQKPIRVTGVLIYNFIAQ